MIAVGVQPYSNSKKTDLLSQNTADWESGTIDGLGNNQIQTLDIRMKERRPLDHNTRYVISYSDFIRTVVIHYWDKDGGYLGYASGTTGSAIAPPIGATKFNLRIRRTDGEVQSPSDLPLAKITFM